MRCHRPLSNTRERRHATSMRGIDGRDGGARPAPVGTRTTDDAFCTRNDRLAATQIICCAARPIQPWGRTGRARGPRRGRQAQHLRNTSRAAPDTQTPGKHHVGIGRQGCRHQRRHERHRARHRATLRAGGRAGVHLRSASGSARQGGATDRRQRHRHPGGRVEACGPRPRRRRRAERRGHGGRGRIERRRDPSGSRCATSRRNTATACSP
jgi:hypothetical protein